MPIFFLSCVNRWEPASIGASQPASKCQGTWPSSLDSFGWWYALPSIRHSDLSFDAQKSILPDIRGCHQWWCQIAKLCFFVKLKKVVCFFSCFGTSKLWNDGGAWVKGCGTGQCHPWLFQQASHCRQWEGAPWAQWRRQNFPRCYRAVRRSRRGWSRRGRWAKSLGAVVDYGDPVQWCCTLSNSLCSDSVHRSRVWHSKICWKRARAADVEWWDVQKSL